MTTNDRRHAFPTAVTTPSGTGVVYGMTLRAYFAAKAMQGILSADTGFSMSINTIAESAVMQADAMLAALEEQS